MILKVVTWNIKPNMEREFELAFDKAQKYLANAKGYKSHQFQRCIETFNKYILRHCQINVNLVILEAKSSYLTTRNQRLRATSCYCYVLKSVNLTIPMTAAKERFI